MTDYRFAAGAKNGNCVLYVRAGQMDTADCACKVHVNGKDVVVRAFMENGETQVFRLKLKGTKVRLITELTLPAKEPVNES